jgi:hypothetical protein
VREAAEYPNSFIPLGPQDERVETERFTLCMSAGMSWNTVQRQRFQPEEIDEVLAEVRSLLRARGRTRTQWEIGSRARPEKLATLLLDRGLVPDEDPTALALALTTEPPPPPPGGLIARRVRTLEEYVAANDVQFRAFGTPPAEMEEQREIARQAWETAPRLMHAVWLDGRLVSAGTCATTPHGLALFGGATVPEARGRGAYRALIRARWDEAVSLSTPTLLTQAGSMSAPILRGLGFVPVGRIEMLIDEFGPG